MSCKFKQKKYLKPTDIYFNRTNHTL